MIARWIPQGDEWMGRDAYIVGGGPSLRSFDWDLLAGDHAIGCNSAFLLGAHVIDICVFGDVGWWRKIGRQRTSEYGGVVVGCVDERLSSYLDGCPWLLTMARQESGLGTRGTLAWNGNTGSLAINLALSLGAQRLFLLGFDMQARDVKRPNWHDLRCEPGRAEVYPRFCKKFGALATALPIVFPGREIVNVTDGSELNCFPKVSLAEHFGGKA